ncbi:hypothetical protein ACKWTF_003416 [Chironomus riparius]
MNIEDLKVELYDSNKHNGTVKCKICYLKFLDDEKICILTCQHTFHHSCFNVYVKSKSSCPECQMEVKDTRNSRSLVKSNGNRRTRSSRRRQRRSRTRSTSLELAYIHVKPRVSGSPTRQRRYQQLDTELWGRESQAGTPDSNFNLI